MFISQEVRSFIHIYKPELYVLLTPTFMFFALTTLISFYQYVLTLTKDSDVKMFSYRKHYAFPVIYTIVLLIWFSLTPYEIRYANVKNSGGMAEGYELFSLLANSKLAVFFAFNILYFTLCFRCLKEYKRKIVDYSADEGNSLIPWMVWLLVLSAFSIAFPLFSFFIKLNDVLSNWIVLIPMLMLALKGIILVYNTSMGKYVLITADETDNNQQTDSKIGSIDKQSFENYISDHKPYLNADLKITDLASDLGTNKTYLSNFINKEYGISFTRYINQCRLIEYIKISDSPQLQKEDRYELILKAGFSSVRAYTRVLNSRKEL